ncbi:MAG: kelch repeat-containing protein, partial [Dehalococcoidia bacterium]|nr:kelch repeat-containing protein [Dehalococcoidia bacterium]
LFGGRTADGPVNDLWLFDAASDTWTQQTAEGAPSPRFGHDGALTAAGSLLVFGGSDGEADFDELWELIGLA